MFGRKAIPSDNSCCIPSENLIQLDINQLIEDVKRDKITFEKAFSETLSHEFLHVLLYRLEGYKTCAWIDDISARKMYKAGKLFSLKDWHGGIYGYKEIKK